MVSVFMPSQAFPNGGIDFPDYMSFCANQHTLSCLAVENWDSFDFSDGKSAERIVGALCTASMFPGNGFPFVLGRPFTSEEDQPGGPRVVVLSEAFWRSHFNSDPDIVGKNILLNGLTLEVIGVVEAEHEWRTPPKVYLPLNLADVVATWRNDWRRRDGHFLLCFGRLKNGVTIGQAQADFEVIQRNLVASFPEDQAYGIRVEDNLHAESRDYISTLWLLGAAAACLLLISNANVSTLLFSRGMDRQREMTIRAAIGASRARLIGYLLLESGVLSLLGGLVGIPISWCGIQFIKWVSPEDMIRVFDVSLSVEALLFCFGVATLTAILSGLFPALFLSKTNFGLTLRSDGERGSTTGLRRKRIQSIMMTSQVALVCMLLIAAGLLVRSFQAAQSLPLGFRPDHVLTTVIYLVNKQYREPGQASLFFDKVLEKIRHLPGVIVASCSNDPPFFGEDGYVQPFVVLGRSQPEREREPTLDPQFISPDYFSTLRIPMLQGRDFDERDRSSSENVVIINKALGDAFFPNQSPLGKQLKLPGSDSPEKPCTVIGVVQNSVHGGPDHHPLKFDAYFPYRQHYSHYQILMIRSSGDPVGLMSSVRKIIASIDPEVPLEDVLPFDERMAKDFATRRLTSLVVSIFSGAALLLSVVGLYGVLAYAVSQQTREIGVRIAVGALQRNILGLVFTQGFRIVGLGVAAGVLGAIGLSSFLGSFLYGVGGNDPLTIALSILILCFAAFLACLPPALRASRIDPITALRE
jgi:putative ABC transport system permease protein